MDPGGPATLKPEAANVLVDERAILGEFDRIGSWPPAATLICRPTIADAAALTDLPNAIRNIL